MFTVEHKISIQKPLVQVFAFTADPRNDPQWQQGLTAVDLAEFPPKVGTQYTEKRTFLGREMKTTVEYTALEANKRIALKSVDGPVAFEIEMSFAESDGATQIELRAQGEAGGFFKLAEGAVAKQLEKSLQEGGSRLKALLESRE